MKVYLVWIKDIEPGLTKIFSNRKSAEKYCELLQKEFEDYCWVEEVEVVEE